MLFRSRSATKSFDFVNTTGKTKDITKYFGVWIAGNYGKTYSNQATAKCTVTPASYLVTFDPNGGRVSPTSTAVTIGKKYGPLPTPNRYGYNFDGWYTEKTGGTKVTSDTTVTTTKTHILYAHWSLTPAKAPTNVVLTMDKTSVYGAEFSRRVSSASTNDYTTT